MNFKQYLDQKLIQFNVTEEEFISHMPKSYKKLAENWFAGVSKPNKKSRFEINSVFRKLFLIEVIKVNADLNLENKVLIEILTDYFVDQYELDPKELHEIHAYECQVVNDTIKRMVRAFDKIEENTNNLYKFEDLK